MAIVSSIRAPQITNEFNVGANCLRNYLRYSEALSSGDLETAQRVLAELSPSARNRTRKPGDDLVADQLAEALREEGWLVDRDVGQSHFRCHLAVAAEGDASYRLGILLPDSPSQANVELMERDVLRPRLLRNFGWKIVTVLTRDWCLNREEVLKTLRKDLGSPS